MCPICKEYTRSIHDKLKSIELKYLKIVEYDCKINIIKKRFVCHKCNKRFTENLDLNQKGKTVSNKLEQKILKDLINYSDYEHAKEEMKEWIGVVKSYDIEEITEVAKVIENWLPYIVNSFINKRFSNGFTEGLNNKIKVIKKVAFGYKKIKFFRLRLMYISNEKISGMSKKIEIETNEKTNIISHKKTIKNFKHQKQGISPYF